jgi:hypothetical protein
MQIIILHNLLLVYYFKMFAITFRYKYCNSDRIITGLRKRITDVSVLIFINVLNVQNMVLIVHYFIAMWLGTLPIPYQEVWP